MGLTGALLFCAIVSLYIVMKTTLHEHVYHTLPALFPHYDGVDKPQCLFSGDDESINRLLETGDEVVLCPKAVFCISGLVGFTRNGQKVYTKGLPTGTVRAVI